MADQKMARMGIDNRLRSTYSKGGKQRPAPPCKFLWKCDLLYAWAHFRNSGWEWLSILIYMIMTLLNFLAGHVVFSCTTIRNSLQDGIHCR